MPASNGPNVGFKYGWSDFENAWGSDMNDNLIRADALTQLAVKDKDLSAPPGSPVDGDRYIVAGSPTGAWTGHTKEIALFINLAWRFYAPKEGWTAWVNDEDVFYVYNGSSGGIPA